ncbi:NAD-dependent epimerase/dehydratase family protein [Roseibium suaedae]|uniref:dTDP-glucose 4,6-dehydratase/UDP-glucose 4-epimerase n=1 Tax=Roseibium suaedae TaxID=735517 RepID=A0A1M7F1R4_9HYPH|nr:NAD(P)-dependent oxidoreductase [Roseibium suaedae]SHL97647.1 dTDP-glucose 4,6-dehydratase/UDP-glucose 4-epimerase [Roseibium suaedae]
MARPILVTGSSGLIGSALIDALKADGREVRGLDSAADTTASWRGDTRDIETVTDAVSGCAGIIHLAAVSRVLWGEQFPDLCEEVNVGGTRNVLNAALAATSRPFVLFGSSREVYGPHEIHLADETTARRPMNVYGRSKLAGEELMEAARDAGLTAGIMRFSNVYGRISDHADRVVPAFARAAVEGRTLSVEGRSHVFDFNYLDDVVDGIVRLIHLVEQERKAPEPIQFTSGTGTSLTELAELSVRLAGTNAEIRHTGPRSFDVHGFVGSGQRAKSLLGWQSRITVEEGVSRMVHAYRACKEPVQSSTLPFMHAATERRQPELA